MRKIINVLIFIFFSFQSPAQDCLDVLQSPLYHNPKEIINGTKWASEKRYTGNPLLEKNYWPKADILFDGKLYRNIQMNYDVLMDEIIIFNPEKGNEKYVVINKEKLSGFSYPDSLTQRKHIYLREKLPQWKEKALYEKVPLEKIQLYIKPEKNLKVTSSETNSGKLSDYYNYYIDLGNGLERFSSKRQLMKLLSSHRTEMKKYIKKEKLTVNDKHPEEMILAIKYFESLNK